MKYISTRGNTPAQNFENVVLTGLASDGGLFVPETLPTFSRQEIAAWAGLRYSELAFRIIQPFVGGTIPDDDLKELLEKSYGTFRHAAIAPQVQIDHNLWVLELFHGPTLAFKDFALQFLGNLLEYILDKRQQRVAIMGATSGDTGSAAIEGCRRCKHIDIFILHPHNRVSDVQRRQMTTVMSDNVFNIALEGNFDDCQNLVKTSFADQSFLPEGRPLVAVNSINWARIMAQIVYYFYAALAHGAPEKPMIFSVPTGNFGDIFAGYLAHNMGLPIEQLLIATNANDILHRCISANDYSKRELVHSLSPSMDILVSSNFERLLFDLYDQDGEAVRGLMAEVATGSMTLKDEALAKARRLFASYRIDDSGTIDVIADVYRNCEYLLDPHSAIGVGAARACRTNIARPRICLATAHPAKFPDAVRRAGFPQDPPLPQHMTDLFDREERFKVLPNQIDAVHRFMADSLTRG